MARWDFTADEFMGRRMAVQQAMGAADLDWMILFHPVSIHWLIGSDAKSYQAFQCLLVPRNGAPMVLIMRQSEEAEIRAETLAEEVVPWGGNEPEDPLAVFAATARHYGLLSSRVGMEVPAYYLHPHHYEKLRDILGAALKAEPSTLVHDLKLVKSDQEISYIRKAAAIADAGMVTFQDNLSAGKTELALAGEVFRTLMLHGSGQAASTLNLVSGERAAFSHGAPTERTLVQGDFGNIEFGAAYKRYTSTIGRQFSLGPPSGRNKEIYSVVRAATEAAITQMQAGRAAIEPHEAAKSVIARAGFDRFRVHTSGYGLSPGFPPSWGEPLSMFGGCDYVLKAGMVITVEPPVFIDEEASGARLIENILITDTGPEVLSRLPRDLIIV